jgi:hypothetical protein
LIVDRPMMLGIMVVMDQKGSYVGDETHSKAQIPCNCRTPLLTFFLNKATFHAK